MAIFTVTALVIALILGLATMQGKLTAMNENIDNALEQIGVLLSSRRDVLATLSELIGSYGESEHKTIPDAVCMRTSIAAKSTVQEIQAQEDLLTDAVDKFRTVAEKSPTLKTNDAYIEAMEQMDGYEDAMRKACRAYNDGVNELNRVIRVFPVSFVAGFLHIKSRDRLELYDEKSMIRYETSKTKRMRTEATLCK